MKFGDIIGLIIPLKKGANEQMMHFKQFLCKASVCVVVEFIL